MTPTPPMLGESDFSLAEDDIDHGASSPLSSLVSECPSGLPLVGSSSCQQLHSPAGSYPSLVQTVDGIPLSSEKLQDDELSRLELSPEECTREEIAVVLPELPEALGSCLESMLLKEDFSVQDWIDYIDYVVGESLSQELKIHCFSLGTSATLLGRREMLDTMKKEACLAVDCPLDWSQINAWRGTSGVYFVNTEKLEIPSGSSFQQPFIFGFPGRRQHMELCFINYKRTGKLPRLLPAGSLSSSRSREAYFLSDPCSIDGPFTAQQNQELRERGLAVPQPGHFGLPKTYAVRFLYS